MVTINKDFNDNFFTRDQETIIALCTPRGSGAIALLRLSGLNCWQIVSKISLLSSKKNLLESKTHTIEHGYIIDHHKQINSIIDEVLFFLMRAPKTFTGQDTIEISCHNNNFIIEKIIELAILSGARLAEHGEFSKRAFLNNKIDLLQAESINDLINAQTEIALKKSLSQLQGSLSNFLENIETNILGLLGIIEGSFEFLQEEHQDLNFKIIIDNKIKEIFEQINNLKINFSQQEQIRSGIKISILGSVNSGKSTLFNSLLKKDKAIVSNIAGTTRDSIESSIYKNSNFWTLVDTAGLRSTEDILEKEGIERSLKQTHDSDIILLVFDNTYNINTEELNFYKKIIEDYKNKIIFIENKIDLENFQDNLKKLNLTNQKITSEIIRVSALKKINLDILEKEIEKKINSIFSKAESPYLLNQRQYAIIVNLEEKLKFIVSDYNLGIDYELVAYRLKEILENLSELTGKNVTEKMLDKVFKDFCIGK